MLTSDRSAANLTSPMLRGQDFRVVALISAFNEGDIISRVIQHLIENDVLVYLIDNNSTDDTVAQAQPWLTKGLLNIEPYSATASAEANGGRSSWWDILRRKEELAVELDADWFIHHDADEVREAPWPEASLKSAIQWVDRLGYNCIEFSVLNFPPVDDEFRQGMDPRQHFKDYDDSVAWFDSFQRKCWKKTPEPVSLAEYAGHDVRFPRRRIFPIPFMLRHYPVRSQTHGVRKVFAERKPRFAASDFARGWHRQYDHIVADTHDFLADPRSLQPFDADAVRLRLLVPQQPRFATTPDGPQPSAATSPQPSALTYQQPSPSTHTTPGPQSPPVPELACCDVSGPAAEFVASAKGTVPPPPALDWGELRRLRPLSDKWGFDRGAPIDRYYLDKFLLGRRRVIRGHVLEVKDPLLTLLYGNGVERSDVVDIERDNPAATMICDLGVEDSLPSERFDCFILTQTLHMIYEAKHVIANAHRSLKPGGSMLTSLPCASRIDPEGGILGDFWRFTPASGGQIFADVFGPDNVELKVFGNVLTSAAFLFGLAAGELTPQELDHRDLNFPLLVCVHARKRG